MAITVKSMASRARWPGFVVWLFHCRLDTLGKIPSPLWNSGFPAVKWTSLWFFLLRAVGRVIGLNTCSVFWGAPGLGKHVLSVCCHFCLRSRGDRECRSVRSACSDLLSAQHLNGGGMKAGEPRMGHKEEGTCILATRLFQGHDRMTEFIQLWCLHHCRPVGF